MKKTNRGKLFLLIGVTYFLFAFLVSKFDDEYETYKLIGTSILALISFGFFLKFYVEDKKAGLPVTKYFMAFGFIFVTALYTLYMLFFA
jgi:hypothetical protein